MKKATIIVMFISIYLSSCGTIVNSIRATTNPTVVKAVLCSGLNADGSPIDERILFKPNEKIFISLYLKNSVSEKTIIKIDLNETISRVTKYLVAKHNGDQYIGIDTGITDPFTVSALGGEYIRNHVDNYINISFISPENGVLLIDRLHIIIND